MVNLLFISNSKNIDAIRTHLQPLLKVRIDIVSDFDYGLKDVFEKRPATVFIQDHIAGVTGESVARHIQMLLGAGSPSFIFMHEGSTRAKPIKGLFEYLIDLSQSESKVVEDIQASLKSLLGPQWEKIYIPPVTQLSSNTTIDSLFVDDNDRTEQLVDSLFSDIDATENLPVKNTDTTGNTQSSSLIIESFDIVSSPHEQLEEMLSELNNSAQNSEDLTVNSNESSPPEIRSNSLKIKLDSQSEINKFETRNAIKPKSSPAADISKTVYVVQDTAKTSPNSNVSSKTKPSEDGTLPQEVSSTDFVIVDERKSSNFASDDLLRAFENNLKPNYSSWGRYALLSFTVIFCICAGVWYLNAFSIRSKLAFVPYSNSNSVALAKKTVETPKLATITPEASIVNIKDSYLPTFIPLSGFDKTYSSQKPGWERYVDTNADYRVCIEGGKVKAIQVLGVENKYINKSVLLTTLDGFVGKNSYQILSKEIKGDINIERASITNKSDLLIYKKNNEIIAFVVSK